MCLKHLCLICFLWDNFNESNTAVSGLTQFCHCHISIGTRMTEVFPKTAGKMGGQSLSLSLSHSVCGTTLNKDVRLFIEYPSLIGCSTHSSKIEWADSKVFPCMPKKSLASPATRRFKQLRLKKFGLNVSTHWLIDCSKSDKAFWLESADTYKKCASDLICRNKVAELVMHASLPQTHFKRI